MHVRGLVFAVLTGTFLGIALVTWAYGCNQPTPPVTPATATPTMIATNTPLRDLTRTAEATATAEPTAEPTPTMEPTATPRPVPAPVQMPPREYPA